VSKNKFESFLDSQRLHIDRLLNSYLSRVTRGGPPKFNKAIHYVVSGGKRLRPLLVYIVGMAYGANLKILDAPACALELIHIFSLVHDDLPAMDNDALRRGKPTCHIAFNEATAILVGDALITSSLQILSEAPELIPKKKVMMNKVLTVATGPKGLIGGQYLDLHMFRNKINRQFLQRMYLLKTGALVQAAVKLGAIAADVDDGKELKLLERFAQNIGLAFQITDDILNIEGNTHKLGKNIGTDKLHNKVTYPALIGLLAAKAKVKQLCHQSEKIVEHLYTKKNFLLDLVGYIMRRDF
jgi:geranylgeranyl pyrophosphate synthase